MTHCGAESDLLARNLDVFRERNAGLAERLEEITEPVSKRLLPPEDNISVEGSNLYPQSSTEWARLQLEGTEANGERLTVKVNNSNISDIGMPLFADMRAWVRDNGVNLAPLPVVDVGFHLVFGVGLGHHVLPLVERTSARRLVLIEPVVEFLRHSLETVDWAEIYARADERGIAIEFIVHDQPEIICRLIEREVMYRGKPFLDGTHCFFHYYSWTLREAYTLFAERQRHVEMNMGFFEDEKLMMANAFGNYVNNAFHLIARKGFVEQKTPIFICGSGPSLHTCLDALKLWRKHVVLMSCGTSLGPLLRAGIRPDIHCENENVPETYDMLKKLVDEHGPMTGITLVATSTVPPSVTTLFERVWFYQRGALTASTIIAPGIVPMAGADPLVSNAGFAVAVRLGFQEIYLFGTDCGAKDPDAHHTKGAYTFATEEEKKAHDDKMRSRFDRKVPGNFGGKVYSAWHLDLSRRMFEEVQRERSGNLFNCSDGARITGAKPKAPRSLKFAAQAEVPRVLTNLERQMTAYGLHDFARALDLDTPLDAFTPYRDWVEGKIADARETGNISFHDLWRAIMTLPEDKVKEWKPPTSFLEPPLESMIWVAAYLGDRMPDEDVRGRYFAYFLDRLAERVATMFDDAHAYVADLKDKARAAIADAA